MIGTLGPAAVRRSPASVVTFVVMLFTAVPDTADRVALRRARRHVVAADGDRDESDVPAVRRDERIGGGDLSGAWVGHPAGCVRQDVGTPDPLRMDVVVAPPQPKFTSFSLVWLAT